METIEKKMIMSEEEFLTKRQRTEAYIAEMEARKELNSAQAYFLKLVKQNLEEFDGTASFGGVDNYDEVFNLGE